MSYYLDSVQEIIDNRISIFNNTNSITVRNSLPSDGSYPLQDNIWLQIPNVICIYVDIRGSTKLTASTNSNSTASIYELFTGTAIDIFHSYKTSYMDIKGDGVFALFNSYEPFRSLAAAVTFKTFAIKEFLPNVRAKINSLGINADIGFHMGIDQKTVLVKQIGLKNDENRDIRKNEVWAGKPVNMAAKLAALTEDGELLVSDRYFNNFKGQELVLKSCGCKDGKQTGEKSDLWDLRELNNDNFDFQNAYVLKSYWCPEHGKDWCKEILSLDS